MRCAVEDAEFLAKGQRPLLRQKDVEVKGDPKGLPLFWMF
ncbi:hypothetical protein DmGdi_08380 [Gluconobacter sp. Gdi]|nr:hypothetical protein DmGdi_08380 [Gluconobacter sp. Gdi]